MESRRLRLRRQLYPTSTTTKFQKKDKKKRLNFDTLKASMFPDHVILTKILGSRSQKKKGVWGAFLGVFVDRIVRFGAIAESDGVILEKWTKFY